MSHDYAISARIRSFLGQHPPFSYVNEDELVPLIQKLEIEVAKKGKILFEKGQLPQAHFYIVRKGAVHIEEEHDQVRILVDQCGEGDLFGIRPILAESPYMFSAVVHEDAIIYHVPFHQFRPIFNSNPDVAAYMVKRFAAGMSIRDTFIPQNPTLVDSLGSAVSVKLNYKKELVYALPEESIQGACQKMSKRGVGSIIILNDKESPIGIVTDRDIRNLVARGGDTALPISSIMSDPVECVGQDTTLPEIQLAMMETGFHHLCVTEDGTSQSKAVGMVTEHDLLFAHSSDPVVLVKEIKHAQSISKLKELRDKMDQLAYALVDDDLHPEIPLKLSDKLNRLLLQKVIEMALEEYTQIRKMDFAFYSMGSMARGEQMLRTDQDNGIILRDGLEDRRNEFISLAKTINTHLDHMGYDWCPANMMASNPMWCKTVSEYKKEITRWIDQPGPDEVLLTATFFDYRFEYGNGDLSALVKSFIKEKMGKDSVYMRFLAQQAIKYPPPLSFFRKFLVEKDGVHADLFDIKLKGIAPLVDAIRCLSLGHGLVEHSHTITRLNFLQEVDQGNLVLYEQAKSAFYALLTYRVMFHLKNGDGGRYIRIDQLDKLQRLELREAFMPTRKLQDMIHRQYKLGYL